MERGPPRWAIPGPARLTRRPAGLPTLQSLRSASVFDGALLDQKQERGGLIADRFFVPITVQTVGAGLPAMQATRYIRHTQLMPLQASQLPQKSRFHRVGKPDTVKKCGSGLARECSVSANEFID
ncbi:MAG: hypothetical protein CFE47_30475 [Pseudomonas sp. PGPPP1]|nr:MAG: hypothetical protein CFE47_30475 [Pseudomonas sp. PGPPP1]